MPVQSLSQLIKLLFRCRSLFCLGRQILVFACLSFCFCAPFPSLAQEVEKDLILSNIILNGKLSYNSEIYLLGGKIYLPTKQILQIVEEKFSFDRVHKTIEFVSRKDSQKVVFDGISQSIKVGETLLDKANNNLFWINQGFTLQDDVLLDKSLLESLLEIKITFDENNAYVNLTVNRPLKALAQEIFYKDSLNEYETGPKPERFNVRSMQVNISSLGNVVNSPNSSSDPFTFGNQVNLFALGDAFGGTYRVGPSLFLDPQGKFGFGGFQNSWSKKLNEKTGLVLGDSNPQLDPINFPAGSVLGVRVGSPQKLNLSLNDGFSFQGKCEPNSEVLLFFNQQVIARQICKKSNYNFTGIPRLNGTNSFYKVVQNGTDGTQITLRESQYNFFDNLLQKNEKQWEAFVGRPSFMNSLFVGGNNDDQNEFNKILAGGMFKYGINSRFNVQAAVSGDRGYSAVGDSTIFATSNGFKPLFSDNQFLEGQTASIGLIARPKDNLGLNLYAGVSNSTDISTNKIFRAGPGYALLGNFDYRYKNLYSQGNFFHYSPGYYTPLNPFSNRQGVNFSTGYSFGNNSLSVNYRAENTNLDELSFGGKTSNQNILISHSSRLGKRSYITNFANRNSTKNDLIDVTATNARSTIRYRAGEKLDLTLSGGYLGSKNKKTNENFKIADITPGFTLYFGKQRQHQLSAASSHYTDGSVSQFVQGRATLKENLVFQPSLNRFVGEFGDETYLFSNGLFWEKQSGLRFGLEHLYNLSKPANGGKKASNQSLRVSALFNLGFAEGKPYLMSSSEAGHLVANVFVDSNNNGMRDGREQSIQQAKLIFKDKPLELDAAGRLRLKDIPSGIYEMYLDPLSLPFAVIPINQNFKFRIEAGRLTELNFTTKVSGGSVSGEIVVYDLDHNRVSAENVVVVALDKDGKEVGYTYTNRRNQYTLSELPAGEYTIRIDELDIEKRGFKLQNNFQKAVIEENLNELVEISDIDFVGTQNIF